MRTRAWVWRWSWLLGIGLACGGGGDRAEQRAGDDDTGAAVVERGRYLVEHVAGCGDCHSPRRADRSVDRTRWLAGVDCFYDVAPDDPAAGCISSRNLTNHETGLKNRSDRAIKDMFMRGVRPDGSALHPFMPYAAFGNMRESDADAIVAYLRTVEGVAHMTAPSQPPLLAPEQPAPRIGEAKIPMPRPGYPDREAALRGRYLAGNIGSCLMCHTPRGEQGMDLDRAFEGGASFERVALGLPSTYPDVIYTPNLTPHATGILGYSLAGIVRALKHGEDANQGGQRLCPPMPAGPSGSFGGLTDEDARDIGHYLLSLEPREHRIPADCAAGERTASRQE
jgi:mono/diheme cytochrome c family protein